MLTQLSIAAALLSFEMLLWIAFMRFRRILAAIAIVTTIGGTVLLLSLSVHAVTVLAVLVGAYRICNIYRLIRPRRHTDYLYSLARHTSISLVAVHLVLGAGVYGAQQLSYEGSILPMLAGLSALMSAGLLGLYVRSSRTTRPAVSTVSAYSESELPTVSVLIPARNETEDLTQCLQSLVQSDYPKLEIIVLDDCSQNTRTPEIIKKFAHDGVRFIPGKAPGTAWLAKNYAYSQLASAASGELLLFCGVDARFKPESLRVLVTNLLNKKKTMISLLPANTVPPALSFESLLVQPSRYAWELVPPRRWFDRPPVLSTCWVIQKKIFDAAGGFKACSRSVSPERYLARYAATHNDGYSFMQSDTATGVRSTKAFSEQQATAIRTRYPQLHQRIELALLVSAAEFVLLVMPFVLLLGALLSGYGSVALLASISVLLLTVMYAGVMQLTYRRFLLRSLWLLPFAALYDIALLNYSMLKYEFSEVIWKGRNVCIPVMRVIPCLPEA